MQDRFTRLEQVGSLAKETRGVSPLTVTQLGFGLSTSLSTPVKLDNARGLTGRGLVFITHDDDDEEFCTTAIVTENETGARIGSPGSKVAAVPYPACSSMRVGPRRLGYVVVPMFAMDERPAHH